MGAIEIDSKRLLTSLVVSGDITEELPETRSHGAIQVLEILDGSRCPSARLIFTHFIILQKELAEFNNGWFLPSSGEWEVNSGEWEVNSEKQGRMAARSRTPGASTPIFTPTKIKSNKSV